MIGWQDLNWNTRLPRDFALDGGKDFGKDCGQDGVEGGKGGKDNCGGDCGDVVAERLSEMNKLCVFGDRQTNEQTLMIKFNQVFNSIFNDIMKKQDQIIHTLK